MSRNHHEIFDTKYADEFMSAFAKRNSAVSPVGQHNINNRSLSPPSSRPQFSSCAASSSPAVFSPFVIHGSSCDDNKRYQSPQFTTQLSAYQSPPNTQLMSSNHTTLSTDLFGASTKYKSNCHSDIFSFHATTSATGSPPLSFRTLRNGDNDTMKYMTEYENDGDVVMRSPAKTPRLMKQSQLPTLRNPHSPQIRSNAVSLMIGPEYSSAADKIAAESKIIENRKQMEKRMDARRSARLVTTKVPEKTSAKPFSVYEDRDQVPRTVNKSTTTPCKLLSKPPTNPNRSTTGNFFDYDLTGKSPSKFHIGSSIASTTKLQNTRANRPALKAVANLPPTSKATRYVNEAKARQNNRLFSMQNTWF